MPNFIIGAAMVAESLNILNSKLDNLLRGTFNFSATQRKRLYLAPTMIVGRELHECYNPLDSSKFYKNRGTTNIKKTLGEQTLEEQLKELSKSISK